MTGRRANLDHFVILLRPRGLLLDLGDWLPQLLCCLLLHGGASSYFFKILPLIVLLDFYFDIFTWFLHILLFLLDFYFQDFLFGAIKLEFAWILAREKNLDPEMVRMVFEVHHWLWFWSEDDCFEKWQFPAGARDQCAGGERHRHHPLGGHRPEWGLRVRVKHLTTVFSLDLPCYGIKSPVNKPNSVFEVDFSAFKCISDEMTDCSWLGSYNLKRWNENMAIIKLRP